MDDTVQQLQKKFARALGVVAAISKDKVANTGSYSYSYADLDSVLHVCKEACDGQGLRLSQPITVEDGNLIVTTTIFDADSGEALSFPGPGVPIKGDPQQAGSAITYFRRYALMSLFALSTDDDDGGVAHRAVAQPGRRTPAEEEIIRLAEGLSDEDRKAFGAMFRDAFGSGIKDLPESKHGDALTWAKAWIPEEGEF